MPSPYDVGKLKAVYHPVGTYGYKRAMFDFLTWSPDGVAAPDNYVVPLGLNRIAASDMNETNDRFEEYGREFGFYSLDHIVLEVHDGNGLQDTIVSLHTFGI